MRCWSLKTARSTLCHGISCHAYIGRRAVFMPCALRLAPLPSTQPGARQRILGLSPRPLLLAPSRPNARHAADGLLGGLTRSPESWRGVSPFLMDVGLSPLGRAVRRVHDGVHTTEERARGPGTLSFWTKPSSPLWLVGSDDGSVARSCSYP